WREARADPSSTGALDRALAFTALEHVDDVAIPVHELLDGLDREVRRHREVADRVLEHLRAETVGRVVELLAILALPLVEGDEALDDLGGALGGDLHLQQLAEAQALAAVAVA